MSLFRGTNPPSGGQKSKPSGSNRNKFHPRLSTTRSFRIRPNDFLQTQHHGSHKLRLETRCRLFCLCVVARMFATSVGTMMDGEHAFATSGGTAWRRRHRRLRAFRRFVLWHSKMEIAAALHHTSSQRTSTTAAASQTVNFAPVPAAATSSATAPVLVNEFMASAPVNKYVASARVIEYVAPALVIYPPGTTCPCSPHCEGSSGAGRAKYIRDPTVTDHREI